MFKQDCIILWFPVIFIALLHRHSSKIYHTQRIGKESLKIVFRRERSHYSIIRNFSRKHLNFSQVFFSSLTQIYMSSKIKAILKGKKMSFLYVKALRKCYIGKPLTQFCKYVFSRFMTYWHIFRILEIHDVYTPVTWSAFIVSSCFYPVNNVITALLKVSRISLFYS